MYGEEVGGEMRKGTALQKNKQVKNSLAQWKFLQ